MEFLQTILINLMMKMKRMMIKLKKDLGLLKKIN
jgi:hypothetical protein